MYKNILLRISESYFRHRWLYLLPILLSVIFAGVYLSAITPKYVARGVVYINSDTLLSSLTAINNNDTNWWVTPAQATTNEISELLRTDAFVRAVIQRTDIEQKMSEGPDAVAAAISYVRQNVWVFAQGEKQIQVNASDPQPDTAYQLVNSAIENYVQWKVNAERADSVTAQDFFVELRDGYGAELEAARENIRNYLGEHPEPLRGERPYLETLEIERLNGEIRLAEARYTNALNKEEDAKLALQQTEAQARETYVLIDAPTVPVEPDISLKNLALNAAVFLGVGVVLSILLVVGSAVLNQSVQHPADITSQLGLPVLAVIPDTSQAQPSGWRRRLALPGRKLLKAPEDSRTDNPEESKRREADRGVESAA